MSQQPLGRRFHAAYIEYGCRPPRVKPPPGAYSGVGPFSFDRASGARVRRARHVGASGGRSKPSSRAPVTANRVVTLISALFSWAVWLGQVPEDCNPSRGITRYREKGREQFLSDEEIARLGDTLRQAETVGLPWMVDEANPKAKHVPKTNQRTKVSPFATAAIRLLLFTGCRLREIPIARTRRLKTGP